MVPLRVGLENLPEDRLEVQMMLDLYLISLQKTKYSLVIQFVLISTFSSLSLDDF